MAANWADGSDVSIEIADGSGKRIKGVRCMVEDMADSLELGPTELKKDDSLQAYRVTARGVGGTDNAVVLLQSYLKFN